MADTAIPITAGTGTNVDTRTEATNGNHRQVVVVGDPSTNAGVAPVDATAGLKVDLGTDNDVTVSSGTITETNSTAILADTANMDTNLGTIAGDTTSIDGKTPALGQAAKAGSVPVTLATDEDNVNVDVSSIAAGTNLIGKVGIDQVTANANEVVTKTGSLVGLETGSNTIGKLAANSGVDIGDVDVTSIPDAAVDTNWFQATITSADATTATQVKAKTAAKKIHITSLVISTDTAMNIQLQSDNVSPQVVMEQVYLAANGGIALTFPERFPLQVNTNEDLDVIASAAGNISVTVTGYVV